MTKSRGIYLDHSIRGFWVDKTCSVAGCDTLVKAKNLCRKHYLQAYRTGSPSRVILDDGYTTNRGYKARRIKGRGAVFDHVLIAEKVLGKPLPPGAVVHHYGDISDNTKIAIFPSQAYHRLIHQRLRALEMCGNVDWIWCVKCKRHYAPEFSGPWRHRHTKGV